MCDANLQQFFQRQKLGLRAEQEFAINVGRT